MIIFDYLSITTVRGKKSRFQQLWMYKIFKHRQLSCIPCLGETHTKLQWYSIFPSLFFLLLLLQSNFFPLLLLHQTSVKQSCYRWCINTLRAGLRYIRTSISALKTAVFSCLTNALAPPPIALKRIGPSSRLHSKNFFVWWYGFFVTDVTSEVVLRSFWFMLPGLGHNR